MLHDMVTCFWVCLPCNLILTFSYCHILYYPRATCYVRAHTSDVYHTLSTLCHNNLPFVAKKVLMVGVHDAASCLHCTSEFPLCPPTFILFRSVGCCTSVCLSLLVESVLLLSQCSCCFLQPPTPFDLRTECFRVVSNIFIYIYFIL